LIFRRFSYAKYFLFAKKHDDNHFGVKICLALRNVYGVKKYFGVKNILA